MTVLVAALTIALIHWLRVLILRLEATQKRQQLLVSELREPSIAVLSPRREHRPRLFSHLAREPELTRG